MKMEQIEKEFQSLVDSDFAGLVFMSLEDPDTQEIHQAFNDARRRYLIHEDVSVTPQMKALIIGWLLFKNYLLFEDTP